MGTKTPARPQKREAWGRLRKLPSKRWQARLARLQPHRDGGVRYESRGQLPRTFDSDPGPDDRSTYLDRQPGVD
jgi:hypothetical protein